MPEGDRFSARYKTFFSRDTGWERTSTTSVEEKRDDFLITFFMVEPDSCLHKGIQLKLRRQVATNSLSVSFPFGEIN